MKEETESKPKSSGLPAEMCEVCGVRAHVARTFRQRTKGLIRTDRDAQSGEGRGAAHPALQLDPHVLHELPHRCDVPRQERQGREGRPQHPSGEVLRLGRLARQQGSGDKIHLKLNFQIAT